MALVIHKTTTPALGVPVIISTVVTAVKSAISIVPICPVMNMVAVQTMPFCHLVTNVIVTQGLLVMTVKQILMIVRG